MYLHKHINEVIPFLFSDLDNQLECVHHGAKSNSAVARNVSVLYSQWSANKSRRWAPNELCGGAEERVGDGLDRPRGQGQSL